MKTAVIIDVVLAAVLLGFTLAGAKRGLFRALAGLVIVAAALVGAHLGARALAPPVVGFLQPYLEQRVADKVDGALGGETLPEASAPDGGGTVVPVEPSADGGDGAAAVQAEELLKLMGLDESLRGALAEKAVKTVRDTGVSVITAIAENLVDFLVYDVLFILCFAALLAALKLLAGALDLALKLPVLHALNGLGGAAVGLIEGALLLFLAIWVLRGLGVSFETETAAQTHVLQFFARHTPLDLLLF